MVLRSYLLLFTEGETEIGELVLEQIDNKHEGPELVLVSFQIQSPHSLINHFIYVLLGFQLNGESEPA